MNRKLLIFILILLGGLECAGNGLHYFISGEHYRNTDLRNFAVVVQIAFGLAVAVYGIWDYKRPDRQKASDAAAIKSV